MRIVLRFRVVVLLVCAGFAERVSASQQTANSSGALHTQGNPVGWAGVQGLGDTDAWSTQANKDVLLVLDPNGMHCWEDVFIDSITNTTLLAFVHALSDALTVGEVPGKLLPLQLPIGLEGETEAATFTGLVEEAWQSQANSIRLPSQLLIAFQMTMLCTGHTSSPSSCLDSTRLKVTHVDAFWRAVEQTVAAGHLMPGNQDLPDVHSLSALSNTIIILPRIVTRLHPVHQSPEEHIYRDLAAWDVDFVIQMLQEFLRVSSAKTFPSLAEYRVLPDKVQLQTMYELYYAADPSTHTPPIPTVNLRLAHPQERESELCNAAESSDSERDAAKTALLDAVFELEKALAPEHPVRHLVDAGGSDWMGRYIIKREYSEGSHHVFGLALPQLGPISVAADDLEPPQGRSAADAALSAHVGSHADPPHAGPSESSSDQAQAHTPSRLRQHRSSVWGHVKAVVSKLLHPSSFFRTAHPSIAIEPGTIAEAELQPLGGPDLGSTISTCINPDVPAHEATEVLDHNGDDIAAESGSWVYGGLQIPAELNSLLAETADRLMHYSCGEGWLVQPRIANMSDLEYRVYLLGGASAMDKGDHNAVVYTPCSIHDDGLHTYNVTVPEGMICSDVLPDPGETPADVITTSWRSYEVWAAPEVYSMILKAAHDGAQAMMDSPKGHLMRMVSNVMVRVDVVLGAQWDHTGQVLLWPMINEMDWFNSAGMMTNFWKGQGVPSGSESNEQETPFESEAGEGDSESDRGMIEVQSSAGSKIAQALYKEILAL